MAGKNQLVFPPTEELVASIRATKTFDEAMWGVGLNPNTVRARMRQDSDLRAAIMEAREAQRPQGSRPPANVTTTLKPVTPEEQLEADVLRQQNQELRKLAAVNKTETVREERLVRTITDHLESLEPKYKPRDYTAHKSRSKHHFVLLWSDTHAAETVSLDETNGINEYDWRIMLQRHDQLRRGLLSYQENRPYPVEDLTVLALGDMLSGNIHQELMETNEMPLAEATIQFGLDGAEFLESFVPHFKRIRVAGVIGNHPRAHQKPQAKRKYDNADWLAYHTMQQRLRKVESISFEIPKSSRHPVMVFDKRILALHGDSVGRTTMVDVPWGGIIRHVAKLQNEFSAAGQPIDHFCFGHYHEANAVKAKRIIMNGSIKGPDEYSMEKFGGGSPPMQLLLTFHKEHGLADVSFIDL